MLTTIGYLFAILFVIIGTAFSIVGVLGYVRLPDVYTQIHAIGKVGVFGVVFLLMGVIFLPTLGSARGLVLIVLLMLSGPIVSHAIQSAAYRFGVPMKDPVEDALESQWQLDHVQRKTHDT